MYFPCEDDAYLTRLKNDRLVVKLQKSTLCNITVANKKNNISMLNKTSFV